MANNHRQPNFEQKSFIKTENDEQFDLCCKSCNKLLGKMDLAHSSLNLRCSRCGIINSLSYYTDQLVYLTDNTGKILYINELLEQITGYSAEEILGKTPAVWGKQMPQEFYHKLWKNILEGKKAVAVNLVNRRKNGQLYEARTKIYPILNEKGKVVFFLGIQTAIKKSEELFD